MTVLTTPQLITAIQNGIGNPLRSLRIACEARVVQNDNTVAAQVKRQRRDSGEAAMDCKVC